MIEWNEIIAELRESINGVVEENVRLAPYTSYKIGGPTRLWVAPSDEESIGKALEIINRYGVDLFILGRGSNLIVSDEGWDGVTLSIGDRLSGWEMHGAEVNVLAGTWLLDLIGELVSSGLAGMELMAGIPGSVGGAVRMNAGAFGQETASSVREVRGFTLAGKPFVAAHDEISFGYRSVPELDCIVVTSTTLSFTEEKVEVLQERMRDVLEMRAQKQPLEYPSCGSVFKRPAGYYAGALIEEAGFKGKRHGNVMVSEKHAGFILNLGGATAKEVLELIGMIEEEVKRRFGVQLEREVRLIGREG